MKDEKKFTEQLNKLMADYDMDCYVTLAHPRGEQATYTSGKGDANVTIHLLVEFFCTHKIGIEIWPMVMVEVREFIRTKKDLR